MTEEFILWLLAMIFIFIGFIYGFRQIVVKVLTDKYMKESKKLQLLINNIKREYGDFVEKPSDFIGGAMSNMGLDGVMDELGIPAVFKPLAKGFIDKAIQNPELIKNIASKLGVNLDKQTNQESGIPSQL